MKTKGRILLLLLLFGCGNKETREKQHLPFLSEGITKEITHINAIIVEKKDFEQEVISQGKVLASLKSDITFPLAGYIDRVSIKTGQRIKKGALLAQLNNYNLKHECEIIRQEIAQAKLQIETKLISLGYTRSDTSSLPSDLWSNIQLEYSLPNLKLRLRKAEHELKQTQITAPISGVIANVEAQAGNPTNNYEKLCTIIDSDHLKVKFPILEAEIGLIKKGNTIQIFPLYNSDQKYQATITAINPEVDDKGMIWCFASLKGKTERLLDGMKVKIHIKKTIPNQLVLPKSAIIDRQNRFVTFVFRERKAHWVYVEIINENSNQYAIADSDIKHGDTIITQNNFDLSHLEAVILDSLIKF